MKSYEYMVEALERFMQDNPAMRPYLIEQAAGVARGTVYDILARRKQKVYLDTWHKIKAVIESNS